MHENAIESDGTNVKIINLKSNENRNSSLIQYKNQTTKIIDLINECSSEHKRFFSIEVSPLKSLRLDYNAFSKLPLFTAITWLTDTNLACELNGPPPSIELANIVTNSTPVMSHLTCYKLSMEKCNEIIDRNEVCNVLALRGEHIDPGQPMHHASDLIEAIRQHHRHESICISIGGYPEIHPEADSLESDLHYLKAKIDAGASLIITQACFSAEKIIQFIASCRAHGITVPIVPGLFVPHSMASIHGMCRICKVSPPTIEYLSRFEQFKDDEEEFERYSVEFMVDLINRLFEWDVERVCGVHFFTLNRFKLIEKVVEKLKI